MLVLGCGSKTGLTVERCSDAGSRACEHACGPGTQVCEDGLWSECSSDTDSRTCEDACGVGTEMCSESGWSACVVPMITRECTDVCGVGTVTCAVGEWTACSSPVTTRECTVVCGSGIETCRESAWGPCSLPSPVPPVLAVRVRDFHESHPDFERSQQGRDTDFIDDALGADDLPVYLGESRTTSGRAAFDQWYRDTPDINMGTALELALTPSELDPTNFVFDDELFFPIDDELFGNEGNEHNFHFTVQAATEFVYAGGETFLFRGDDDVFVFIDRRLVINLGGVHPRQEKSVELDELAEELGLEVGGRYPLHLFFAERHTDDSSFRIETTISDPVLRCE